MISLWRNAVCVKPQMTGCHVVTQRLDSYLWCLLLWWNVNNQDWSHNHLSVSQVLLFSWIFFYYYFFTRQFLNIDESLLLSIFPPCWCWGRVDAETLVEQLVASYQKQIFDSRFQCLKVLLELQAIIESKSIKLLLCISINQTLNWANQPSWD